MYNNEVMLKDAYINWNASRGQIKNLTDNFDVAWKNSVDGSLLDLEYYGNHSGDKLISPLLVSLLGSNGYIETHNILRLSGLLFAKYGQKWDKLWATLNLNYNPIENYSMTETETKSGENAETVGEEQGGTDEIIESGETTETNSVYGFNGETASPDSESTTSRSNTATTTYGKTNDITRNGTEEESRTLTRAGNIGVTTSQQMIESERALWDWNFFEQVFKDIDEVLTIPAYGGY